MYSRPFPALASVGAVFAGATPQLLLASNPGRANLLLQGIDSFIVGISPTMTASTGLVIGSGVLFPPDFAPIAHLGAVYGISNAAAQATIAIRTWESSQ